MRIEIKVDIKIKVEGATKMKDWKTDKQIAEYMYFVWGMGSRYAPHLRMAIGKMITEGKIYKGCEVIDIKEKKNWGEEAKRLGYNKYQMMASNLYLLNEDGFKKVLYEIYFPHAISLTKLRRIMKDLYNVEL